MPLIESSILSGDFARRGCEVCAVIGAMRVELDGASSEQVAS